MPKHHPWKPTPFKRPSAGTINSSSARMQDLVDQVSWSSPIEIKPYSESDFIKIFSARSDGTHVRVQDEHGTIRKYPKLMLVVVHD